MTAPPTASASVPRKGPAARGGNQSIATGAAPPEADHARATIDATSPTHATRRYCMTATSLMSPPKASAISTIAVAAPGEEPQTAVVPGSTFQRARAKPSAGREKYDRADQGQEHRPFLQDRQQNVGSDAARHEAADKALRDDESPGRDPDASLEPRNQDRGPDRAEQQSRGQAHQLEGRQRRRARRSEARPIAARRPLAQCETRHCVHQAPENASASLSAMRAIRGKIRRIELSWASGAMLLVASLTMMSS